MASQTSSTRRALIIGGGIGGLATAIALRRIGWDAMVFERAPKLQEVGAGLGIWANAMHALDRLGVAPAIRAEQPPAPSGGIYTWRGQTVMAESNEALERRVGEISVVLHRAELQELLYQTVGADYVRLGQSCTQIEQNDTSVTATFADGTRESGDLLIGADGIRSVVRAALVGDDEPRYAGYIAYRGIAHFDPRRIAAGEYWGPGMRFGVAPMTKGRIYWWATRNTLAGGRETPVESHRFLTEHFQHWVQPIPAIIAATNPQAVLRHDIADRDPIDRWSYGRTTLLGDAAHATTPNLGQGACQALEDAVALADALAEHNDIPAALRAYEQRRIPRTRTIVLQSRRIGQIGQWSNPLACNLRDTLLRTFFAPRQAAAIDPIVGYRV